MIPLSLAEVGELCPGRLESAPWADQITGVQIDSRRISEGELFVAVGAGADFRKHALARGAAATLVPDDGFAALAALGRAVRTHSSARVVGITGSTAKTSTKDILAALCRPHARTIAAEASYNNELGVPLTLCRLEQETEICILELAMRGLGQIAELGEIARPDVGVITSIGPAHLELVGTIEKVAEAKAELIAALPPGGVAVVPADAPELRPFLPGDIEIRTFGPGGGSFVEQFTRLDGRSRIRFDLGGEKLELEFNFNAYHQAVNALVALLAYEALGLSLEHAQLGAQSVEFSRWRGEEIPLPEGGLLINDAYNANPISMRAALEHLLDRAEGRRTVAVLGDMAELGERGAQYHREVGSLLQELGVDVLFAVGALAEAYLEARLPTMWWSPEPHLDALVEALSEELRPGDVVLVKGSRVMGLEAVADALAVVRA